MSRGATTAVVAVGIRPYHASPERGEHRVERPLAAVPGTQCDLTSGSLSDSPERLSTSWSSRDRGAHPRSAERSCHDLEARARGPREVVHAALRPALGHGAVGVRAPLDPRAGRADRPAARHRDRDVVVAEVGEVLGHRVDLMAVPSTDRASVAPGGLIDAELREPLAGHGPSPIPSGRRRAGNARTPPSAGYCRCKCAWQSHAGDGDRRDCRRRVPRTDRRVRSAVLSERVTSTSPMSVGG